jgi:hypothetical protein
MTDLIIRTLEGSTKKIAQDVVSALRAKVRGTVALPGEDGYDAARTIWNAMIDRRPGLVVRCLGAADVINAVTLARDENLLVAVRGGGHNIAGNAVCDGGLLIDLSLMKSVASIRRPPRRASSPAPRSQTSTRRRSSSGSPRRSASIRRPASPASRSAAAWAGPHASSD